MAEPAREQPASPAPPGVRGGPTIMRMLLGVQLRRYREASGLSPDKAAWAIRGSRSKISRIEKGRVSFKERDVTDLLKLYGVTDPQVHEAMLVLARQANELSWWTRDADILPGWLEVYLGLEEAASLVRTYELQFIHGLFQTEDYARSVTMLGPRGMPEEQIERRVNLRLNRQKVLRRPEPLQVWSIMDEAALRRPIGGPTIMRDQLRHLLETAELPNVTLQVVPFARGGHAAAGGSFTMLRFAERELRDVVYIEQLTGALYLEQSKDVDYYKEVMDRLSAEAATPASTTRALREIIRTT